MNGFDVATLKPISGDLALFQAVRTVLFTPVGSRVMRRDFGAMLLELLDQPQNNETRLAIFAATALALLRWLPQFRLVKVALEQLAPGQAALRLEGVDRTNPNRNALVRLSVPLSIAAGAGAARLSPA